jgi:hypothetical protein
MLRIFARGGILGSMVAFGLALGTMGCEPEEPVAEEHGFTQTKLLTPQFETLAPLSNGQTIEAFQGQRGAMFAVVRDGSRDVGGFSVIPDPTGQTFLTSLGGRRAIFNARTGKLISGSLVDRRTTPFGDPMLNDLNGLGLRLQGSNLSSSTVGCSGNLLSGLGRGLGALFGMGGMFGLGALGGAFDADCDGPGFDMRSMFGAIGSAASPFGLPSAQAQPSGGALDFFKQPFERTTPAATTRPAATTKKPVAAAPKGCGSCGGSKTKVIKQTPSTGSVAFGGSKDDPFANMEMFTYPSEPELPPEPAPEPPPSRQEGCGDPYGEACDPIHA